MGTYNPSSGSSIEGLGQVSINCTKGDVVSVIPTSGGNTLSGPGGNLFYGLFTDPAASQSWGYQYGTTTWNTNQPPPALYFYKSSSNPTSVSSCAILANGASYFYGNSGTSTGCFWGLSMTNANGNLYAVTTVSASRTTVYVGSQELFQGTTSNVFQISSGTYVSGSGAYSVWTIPVITGSSYPISATSTSVKTPIQLTYYAKASGSQDIPPGTYTDTVTLQFTF